MMARRFLGVFLFLAAIAAVAQADAPNSPKARLELLSAADGVAANMPVDVAIRFRIDEKWHIYWQNSGDSGQPPRVEWSMPDGFVASELRFPVPKRYVESGGIVTNILDGEPAILSTITVPANLTAEKVKLTAKVKYLVCEKICLQESADVSVELPVRASAGDVKPANEPFFDAARRKLPKTGSEYVTVTASADPMELKPGVKFEFTAHVTVRGGYHVQSNKPTLPTLVATDLFIRRVPGVFFDPLVFPEPALRETPAGRMSEYSGAFPIRVKGEVDPDARGPFSLGGVLVFQACDKDGKCFPPEAVEFSHIPVWKGAMAGPSPDTRAGVSSLGATTDSSVSSREPIADPADVDSGLPTTFLATLALAFLGGLILNIMPCVLPVISIKVLSFVQQARESRRRVVALGLTFSLGMLLSFWAMALVIIILQRAGALLGWGFQFQSPRFVIVMMGIMFVFGLSLLGVFMISLPGAAVSSLSAAEEREGLLGAFLKGVLGTILATPCTAPYLGPALGVAFRSTHGELFTIFTSVGLGMASPFVILSLMPGWLKFMPRPGVWMEHFKQVMGFLLMGTVVWMMFTLGDQIGVDGLTWTGGYLVALAFACWLLGRQTVLTPVGRRLGLWAVSLAVIVGGWWFCFESRVTVEDHIKAVLAARECPCETEVPRIECGQWANSVPWQTWSKGRPEHLAKLGYTVYVDYTATWCVTCLANKKATLESSEVRQFMRDHCVIPMKADFTLEDPNVLADLQRFGRSGVPLNVIFPAGDPDNPIVMPEQLVGRTGLVIDRLTDAGTSKDCSCSQHAEAMPSEPIPASGDGGSLLANSDSR